MNQGRINFPMLPLFDKKISNLILIYFADEKPRNKTNMEDLCE